MDEVLKFIKETVDRFGIHFELAIMVRPQPPKPQGYGELNEDILEVGDQEN